MISEGSGMQADFDRHHQGDAEEAGGGDGGDDEARQDGDDVLEQAGPFPIVSAG